MRGERRDRKEGCVLVRAVCRPRSFESSRKSLIPWWSISRGARLGLGRSPVRSRSLLDSRPHGGAVRPRGTRAPEAPYCCHRVASSRPSGTPVHGRASELEGGIIMRNRMLTALVLAATAGLPALAQGTKPLYTVEIQS